MASKSLIQRRLETRAIEFPAGSGRKWVRAWYVELALSVRTAKLEAWGDAGLIRVDRVSVPKSSKNVHGVMILVSVDSLGQVFRLARDMYRRPWTEQEWELVEQAIATQTRAQIAAHLPGRTAMGIEREMIRRGDSLPVILERRHRMIKPARLAKIAGVGIGRVAKWIDDNSLPVHRVPTRRGTGDRYISLDALRLWLMDKPLIVANLPGKFADRLRLDVEGGKVIELCRLPTPKDVERSLRELHDFDNIDAKVEAAIAEAANRQARLAMIGGGA
jgi:hypothetical protein